MELNQNITLTTSQKAGVIFKLLLVLVQLGALGFAIYLGLFSIFN